MSAKLFLPTQQGKQRLKMKAGRQKKEKRRRKGGASRKSPAPFAKAKK
jgi:hypothetical protein